VSCIVPGARGRVASRGGSGRHRPARNGPICGPSLRDPAGGRWLKPRRPAVRCAVELLQEPAWAPRPGRRDGPAPQRRTPEAGGRGPAAGQRRLDRREPNSAANTHDQSVLCRVMRDMQTPVDLRQGPVPCPHQVATAVEVKVAELRRQHSRWGAGPHRAGLTVRFWADIDVIHLLIGGSRVKSVRSHLTMAGLRRLVADGAVNAGPPPLRAPWTARRSRWTGLSPGSEPCGWVSISSSPRRSWPAARSEYASTPHC
jgi:hypothetical protein